MPCSSPALNFSSRSIANQAVTLQHAQIRARSKVSKIRPCCSASGKDSGVKLDGTQLPLLLALNAAAVLPVYAADDAVDSAVNSLVDGVKSTGALVKQGLEIAGQALQQAKEAYKVVEPTVKQATDAATPIVTQGFKTAQDLATPALKALEPQVKEVSKGAEQVLRSTGVDTQAVESTSKSVLQTAEGALSTVKPVVDAFVTFVTTNEPLTVLEYGAGAVVALYLLPPTLGLLLKAAQGYAGEISAAAALDLVCSDGKTLLLDIRTTREKEAGGVPDLPVRDKLVELDYALIEDKKTRNQLRNPAAVEAQITAMQVAALKRLSKGSTLLLLDKNGSSGKTIARELASKGFKRCYVIAGGYEGRNGWCPSKLPIKFASTYSSAEVLPPVFATTRVMMRNNSTMKTQKVTAPPARRQKALPSGN